MQKLLRDELKLRNVGFTTRIKKRHTKYPRMRRDLAYSPRRFESGRCRAPQVAAFFHHLTCCIGRPPARLKPRFAEKSSLSTGTGPGLGVLRGVEVATTTTPEDDEHLKIEEGFTRQAAVWY